MTKFFILITALMLNLVSTFVPASENEIQTINNQSNMLLGEFHKEDLMKDPYSSWFTKTYEEYTPDKKELKTIKKNIKDYDITLFMGTWCHDSKRETPKLLKLLDLSDYNYDNITMYAVDYSKHTPSKAEEGMDIHHVPTIIFYKDGKEVNRFVESASGNSIEEDIAKIVSGEDYKNSYSK